MYRMYQPDILPLNLLLCTDMREIAEVVTELGGSPLVIPEEDVSRRGMSFTCSHNGYRCEAILLGNAPTVGTWAHEAVHTAQAFLEFIGIPWHIGESNEIHAYVVEYIVMCIEDFVKDIKDDEKELNS